MPWLIKPRSAPEIAPEKRVIVIKVNVPNFPLHQKIISL
jgi:hypothetical protein